MAARVTDRAAASSVGERARAGYDDDFYTWSLEQARLVRDGEWAAVDRENVAEEIESLGREQFNKLENAFRGLMLHILKWDHQPERRSRSWTLSIKEQRLRLGHILVDNPGLKPGIQEAMTRGYELARIEAAKETELEERTFPQSCPYSYEDIVSRAFSL